MPGGARSVKDVDACVYFPDPVQVPVARVRLVERRVLMRIRQRVIHLPVPVIGMPVGESQVVAVVVIA